MTLPIPDDLIARASQLTGDQITQLAAATREAMGSGPLVYLGLKSRNSGPVGAASAAIRRETQEEEMRSRNLLLQNAVLQAAITAASLSGRDPSGVLDAWQEFQRAVDSGDAHARQRAFRSAQKVFRRGLGKNLKRDWPTAGEGAAWALLAVLSWNRAKPDGPYTIADRESLLGPWTVATGQV